MKTKTILKSTFKMKYPLEHFIKVDKFTFLSMFMTSNSLIFSEKWHLQLFNITSTHDLRGGHFILPLPTILSLKWVNIFPSF